MYKLHGFPCIAVSILKADWKLLNCKKKKKEKKCSLPNTFIEQRYKCVQNYLQHYTFMFFFWEFLSGFATLRLHEFKSPISFTFLWNQWCCSLKCCLIYVNRVQIIMESIITEKLIMTWIRAWLVNCKAFTMKINYLTTAFNQLWRNFIRNRI